MIINGLSNVFTLLDIFFFFFLIHKFLSMHYCIIAVNWCSIWTLCSYKCSIWASCNWTSCSNKCSIWASCSYNTLRLFTHHPTLHLGTNLPTFICTPMTQLFQYLGGGGGYSHVKVRDEPPKWVIFYKKALNMGTIFNTNIPKHGSVF